MPVTDPERGLPVMDSKQFNLITIEHTSRGTLLNTTFARWEPKLKNTCFPTNSLLNSAKDSTMTCGCVGTVSLEPNLNVSFSSAVVFVLLLSFFWGGLDLRRLPEWLFFLR